MRGDDHVDPYSVNRNFFGHDSFRPGQELLIEAILSGRDCLGIMPTGGGKSLCYQVPALLLPGLTLVVSPLISLMKDQVAALRGAGVPAEYWNSALSDEELSEVSRNVQSGGCKLLYIAPERLDSRAFSALAARLPLSLVAVDEAHCVSQWGQDFRPSYLKIAPFVARLPRRPVTAAFTATATDEVRADIQRILALRDPQVLVTGFDRPNLFFDVQKPKNKLSATMGLIRDREGRSGIVYCSTRRAVETVCDALNDAGIPATRYHAGLDPEERRRNQEDFQFDRKSVMVATNAFGMGIDKSNVNFVIHYNMPQSVEAYYQEAGRAGRDGEPADCILLFSNQDVVTARYLIDHREENGETSEAEREALRLRNYRRLDTMTDYCKSFSCLRGKLLDYFGQEHEEHCGNCGNCCSDRPIQDITVPSQMILSCVQRVKDKLGYHVGPSLIIRVLRGSKDKRVRELGLDGLSTYNLMPHLSQQAVSAMVDRLVELEYAEVDESYHTLRLTAKSKQVLFHGERVEMPVREDEAAPKRQGFQPKRRAAAHEALGDRQELYDRLSALRMDIARQESVPAYVVFPNAALREMALEMPRSRKDFLMINGVGKVKAERYAERFLAEIRRYEEEVDGVDG